MKIADLAWLAGVIDSDGCIGLYQYSPTHTYDTKVIRGMITIANTNKLMMDKAVEIYDSLGITYYLKLNKKKSRWKDCWTITIQNREGITRLLSKIMPYMVVKKEQAQITLEFVGRAKFTKRTDEEIGMLARMRILNRRGSNA